MLSPTDMTTSLASARRQSLRMHPNPLTGKTEKMRNTMCLTDA